ncbi:hypothetical protein [Sphingomonas radiodurans]|uniref:hypothetical protein n=1 Tax=Sphingomonas radiodurans TaxID=2890321 RepID=UPI001E2F0890|nr:hypothetical protein [Sphingomonas radiodurans]WBH16495.1 hypothetical protein LLW23_17185 [Sphingomonas radiodurans]
MTPRASQQIKEAVRARVGQLTKRNHAVVDEILHGIACGEVLVNGCRNPHLPGYSTFDRWCREDTDRPA